MSLSQFWRILWARKLLVIVTALFCLAGGVVAIWIVPPRWRAESHVYLNLLKADPVTGEFVGQVGRAYVATQIALLSDYGVAGLAVDKLGWLSDPDLIAQYQRRPPTDSRDFRRWLAQRVMDGTRADLLDGSNILDITYTGQSPEGAKAIVAAVTQAYLDTTLASRRSEANKNADWFALQSIKAKQTLLAAQAAVAAYERENGIVMRDDKTDIDSARFAALASQGDAAALGGGISGIDAQIAEVDSSIKQAAESLGPNHPQLVALREKRASLMALAAQAGSPQAAGAGMSARIAAAKEAVIGNRDKLARLAVLQSEVDIRKDQYDKTLAREADFRQQAAVVDPGVSALGAAFVPDQPSFPNKPLIIGGSLGLGLVFGLLIALLVELLDRRVRSPEDLSATLGLPVLAVLRPAG
ncbi:MAG: Wzz/FepE/Etk N-terminal domain-containing protein [Rhizomicrobium sp.]